MRAAETVVTALPPARSVLITGAFGQRNPGDESLLAAFLDALHGWRPVVASANPVLTGHAHRCATVHSRSPAAVARALRETDGLVLAGGTVFKTLPSSTDRHPLALLRSAVALATAARCVGRPVAAVGVGVGSLRAPGAAQLARRLVKQCDLLVLRDEESARALAAIGADPPFRVGADAAWSLLGGAERPGLRLLDARETRSGHDRRVVVAVSHLAGGVHVVDRLAEALAPLRRDSCGIDLVPWQTGGAELDDLDVARTLRGRLLARGAPDVRLLAPPADVVQASDALRGARLLVGARFHSLVAAAAAGTPFLALTHEPKLTAVARRFGQVAVPADAAPDDLAAGLRTALRSDRPGADVAAQQVALAREGFRLMRLVLSRGTDDETRPVDALRLEPAVALT